LNCGFFSSYMVGYCIEANSPKKRRYTIVSTRPAETYPSQPNFLPPYLDLELPACRADVDAEPGGDQAAGDGDGADERVALLKRDRERHGVRA